MDSTEFRGAPGPCPRNDQEVTAILSSGFLFTFKSLTWNSPFPSVPPLCNMHSGGSPYSVPYFSGSLGFGKKQTLTLHQVGPDPSLKGKAIAELRPVRPPSSLTYSRSLLLHGK